MERKNRSPSPRRKSSNSNFDILNPDSIYEITNYLSPKDITNLSLTSKKVKDATDMKFKNMFEMTQKRDAEIIKRLPYFEDYEKMNGLLSLEDAIDSLYDFSRDNVEDERKNEFQLLLKILFKYSEKTNGLSDSVKSSLQDRIFSNNDILLEVLFNYYFDIYPQNRYIQSFIQELYDIMLQDMAYEENFTEMINDITKYMSDTLDLKNKNNLMKYLKNIDRFLDDIKNFIPNELELDILSSINPEFLYYYIGKRR